MQNDINNSGKGNENKNVSYSGNKNNIYYWFLGFWSIKARGMDTEQNYSLLEGIIPPGIETPLHVHSREEEAFYIQQGNILFQYGKSMISTSSGDYLYLKRGIPHKFKNIGTNTGNLMVVLSPPGIEQLFEKGVPVQDITSFDFKNLSSVSKSLGSSNRLKTLEEYGIKEVTE
ncbi:MAG: cupin domain-containing protein [Thermoproteota archaeon]|nr:cupin domain-containing protein [Thermoproteota archaeon]